MKTAIYIRVSTQEQNTDLQRAEITQYLKHRGIVEFEVYEDQSTGRNGSRPGLKRLLKDVSNCQIELVVCWKLDRLFRSLTDLMNTLSFFKKCGAKFVSVKEQLDLSTASGNLLMMVLGAVAEFEGELIRERVRAGLKHARARGVKLGTPVRAKPRYDKIKMLRERGMRPIDIAREFSISPETVYRACRAK